MQIEQSQWRLQTIEEEKSAHGKDSHIMKKDQTK